MTRWDPSILCVAGVSVSRLTIRLSTRVRSPNHAEFSFRVQK